MENPFVKYMETNHLSVARMASRCGVYTNTVMNIAHNGLGVSVASLIRVEDGTAGAVKAQDVVDYYRFLLETGKMDWPTRESRKD